MTGLIITLDGRIVWERETDSTPEQLLADLAWVLGAAERAAERARDEGNDTAAALLGGCVARVHAAIGDG